MRVPPRVVLVAALLGAFNLALMVWMLHAQGVPDADAVAAGAGHQPHAPHHGSAAAEELGVNFEPLHPVPPKHGDGAGLDPSYNVTLHHHLHRNPAIDVDGRDPAGRAHAGRHHHHHHRHAEHGAAHHHNGRSDGAHATPNGADAGEPRHGAVPGAHHNGGAPTDADTEPDEDAEDSSEAESSPASTPHHHDKRSFYNVNDPDDMKPADVPPAVVRLDASRNRTYALFHVVGDWGGPGRGPQREVAAAMGEVASGGLTRLLPPDTGVGTGTVTTGERAVGDPAGRDRVARRRMFGAFVQVDGEGTLTDPLHPEASFFKPVASSVDFIVSTGDNMYEDGVKDEFDPKFRRNFENVYTHPGLKDVRWYMSLGNHDHGAHGVMRDVRGQVRYTRRSSRWFLPSTYYVQRINVRDVTPRGGDAAGGKKASSALEFTIDLIVLDVYDVSPFMTKMSDGQLAWFERTLSQSTADWKIVVGHRPIFSAGSKHGSSPYMQKRVLSLLATHRAAMYLCGDDHELQLMESHGVLLGLSGGGARAKSDLRKRGLPETLFQAGVHGFMSVALTRDEIAVSVIDKAGTVLKRVVRSRVTDAPS